MGIFGNMFKGVLDSKPPSAQGRVLDAPSPPPPPSFNNLNDDQRLCEFIGKQAAVVNSRVVADRSKNPVLLIILSAKCVEDHLLRNLSGIEQRFPMFSALQIVNKVLELTNGFRQDNFMAPVSPMLQASSRISEIYRKIVEDHFMKISSSVAGEFRVYRGNRPFSSMQEKLLLLREFEADRLNDLARQLDHVPREEEAIMMGIAKLQAMTSLCYQLKVAVVK